jgi:hypothetical protein
LYRRIIAGFDFPGSRNATRYIVIPPTDNMPANQSILLVLKKLPSCEDVADTSSLKSSVPYLAPAGAVYLAPAGAVGRGDFQAIYNLLLTFVCVFVAVVVVVVVV